MSFRKIVEDNPVLAAVKDVTGLERALKTDIQVIFILFGDVCLIPRIVARVKNSGKIAMVHIDLIEGLNGREIAVDYLKERTGLDGIISTKQNLIKRAQELRLYTVWRFFILDSMALKNLKRQLKVNIKPDMVEIMPGIVPKVIKDVKKENPDIPIVAGGLVSEKEEVMDALKAGAIAVSTTNPRVWLM